MRPPADTEPALAPVLLDGATMTVEAVERVARHRAPVRLSRDAAATRGSATSPHATRSRV